MDTLLRYHAKPGTTATVPVTVDLRIGNHTIHQSDVVVVAKRSDDGWFEITDYFATDAETFEDVAVSISMGDEFGRMIARRIDAIVGTREMEDLIEEALVKAETGQ